MKASESSFLNASDRGFLSTSGSSGRPTIVPVCFVCHNDTIYVPIDDKPKKGGRGKLARLANLEANPAAAFIVDNYSDNWTKLSYLLVHGKGRVVEDRNEAGMAKDLLRRKYSQYPSLKLEIHSVIAIDVEETKLWTFQSR